MCVWHAHLFLRGGPTHIHHYYRCRRLAAKHINKISRYRQQYVETKKVCDSNNTPLTLTLHGPTCLRTPGRCCTQETNAHDEDEHANGHAHTDTQTHACRIRVSDKSNHRPCMKIHTDMRQCIHSQSFTAHFPLAFAVPLFVFQNAHSRAGEQSRNRTGQYLSSYAGTSSAPERPTPPRIAAVSFLPCL